MYTLSHEIHVAARTRTIWQVWSDVTRWSEWTESIRVVEPLQPGPLRAGARYRIVQPELPVATWEVTEYSDGAGFAWVSTAPGVFVEGRHWIVPVRVGCTCRLQLRYERPLGALLGRVLRTKAERYLAMEADGLRGRCEELEWTNVGPPRVS